ncbi:MAG: dicarboxylate/amino acid:cation symporter [Holosporales bacterium]|jgi:Na+/H+-dicarboxylate symporter|nr:dicarboxylate/amino acid:cation symporter [Holosporales bacterium]
MVCGCCEGSATNKSALWYLVAIAFGVMCGLSGIDVLLKVGSSCSEIFVRIFRCISMPVISLSVIIALSSYDSDKSMMSVWKKTLSYTIFTTVAAASVSALLYVMISPSNVAIVSSPSADTKTVGANYLKYFLDIVPDSILGSFMEHKVLSVLLISVIIGIAIRFVKEADAKSSVISFFKGIHSVFFTITRLIVKILPIGLFGFVTVSVKELQGGTDLAGMGSYFLVIIAANIIQGAVILPLVLAAKKINPIVAMKKMTPALSVAFFSKSSSATLPVTIDTIESRIGVNHKISRFALPLCTTINMNGCAAFIFTTVIYVMQNHGIEITSLTILTWVLISTLAAIGNAGVPMGCFFLSASLLSSMGIPMPLMGIILPFYGVIDMIETSLNVWSDACVTMIVDREFKE